MSSVPIEPLPRPRGRKTKHDACGCAYEVDRLLAKRGMRLIWAVQLKGGPRRVFVAAEVVISTKCKPSHVVANYCPFCGTKVPDA